jgi:AraC-like DNA-binding protein
MVDAEPYRMLIVRLCARGWTMSDIADAAGCSRQAVSNIRTRRTRQLRPDLADALATLRDLLDADGCAVCDDVATAALSSGDPNVIAARVGKSVQAIQKHLYRCGQPQLARLFHRHHHREESRA